MEFCGEGVLLFCFEKVQCVELADLDLPYVATLGKNFHDPTVSLLDEKPKHTGHLSHQ